MAGHSVVQAPSGDRGEVVVGFGDTGNRPAPMAATDADARPPNGSHTASPSPVAAGAEVREGPGRVGDARQCWRQRHGVAELMDHRMITTTQGYYRIGAERRREAVDRVTTMQFDQHGNRVWRQAGVMLDSEHQRRAVGEVAVTYGGCSEPANVAADGQDCLSS